MNAALRSALTTFLVTLISLVPVSALVGGDVSWAQSALVAAGLAALRTLVAAVDPGQTSYGIGSERSGQPAASDNGPTDLDPPQDASQDPEAIA